MRANWLPSQFMFSLSKIPRWNKKSQVQHIFLLSRFPPNIMYINSVRCLNKSRPLGQLGYRLYKLKPISSFKQHNGLFPAIPHNEVNYFLSRIWMSKQFHEAFWKKKIYQDKICMYISCKEGRDKQFNFDFIFVFVPIVSWNTSK